MLFSTVEIASMLASTFLFLIAIYFSLRRKQQQNDAQIQPPSIATSLGPKSLPNNNNDPSERRSRLIPENELLTKLYDDAPTLVEALQRGERQNQHNKQSIGQITSDHEKIVWISYTELLQKCRHFADGLLTLVDQVPHKSVIGLFSNNRVEYTIVEYGCYMHSMVIAPIYSTLGPNVCTFIANQAEISAIVCDSLERVEAILTQAGKFTHLKTIIVLEKISYSYVAKAKSHGLTVLHIDDVIRAGAKNPQELHSAKPEDLAVICYTSGTTGTPKGVMLTHGNLIAAAGGLIKNMLDHELTSDDVFLSYLPLAHIMERVTELCMFLNGAQVIYFAGDIQALTKDVQLVKPTIFLTVPRLLNKVYDSIQEKIRGNPFKKWLFETGLAAKEEAYKKGKLSQNTIWDRLMFDKIRNVLGGRIRILALGSASLNADVSRVMRNILSCVFMNGYGQTECICASISFPMEMRADSVGPPLPSALIKLVDIPEMNYWSSEGRGEILVKGPIVTQGYFKDPVETAKLFDEDGWIQTGDVGEWTSDGVLKVIDRKKNFFKLTQGEYIASEKLEIAYRQSNFVAQIYVYGDSSRSFLVAVIAVEQEFLESWAHKNNIHKNLHDLCRDATVKKAVIEDLNRIAKEEQFNSLECIKRVHLHPELFSLENGLVTPTMKMKRFELQKYFANTIDKLYKQKQ